MLQPDLMSHFFVSHLHCSKLWKKLGELVNLESHKIQACSLPFLSIGFPKSPKHQRNPEECDHLTVPKSCILIMFFLTKRQNTQAAVHVQSRHCQVAPSLPLLPSFLNSFTSCQDTSKRTLHGCSSAPCLLYEYGYMRLFHPVKTNVTSSSITQP